MISRNILPEVVSARPSFQNEDGALDNHKTKRKIDGKNSIKCVPPHSLAPRIYLFIYFSFNWSESLENNANNNTKKNHYKLSISY